VEVLRGGDDKSTLASSLRVREELFCVLFYQRRDIHSPKILVSDPEILFPEPPRHPLREYHVAFGTVGK
jgi:hypothetical protein